MQHAYTCFKHTPYNGLMKNAAVKHGILQTVSIAFVGLQMKYKHQIRKLVPSKKLWVRARRSIGVSI